MEPTVLAPPRFRAVASTAGRRAAASQASHGRAGRHGPEQFLQPCDPAHAPKDLAPGIVRRVSDGTEPLAADPVATVALVPTPAQALPSVRPVGLRPMSPLEFCREARRLRAVFEDNPVRMHQELGRLAMA